MIIKALISSNRFRGSISNFAIPLFWGILWGIIEATLGHVLHLIPVPGIAGFVMFPIGMAFMVRAWSDSGRISAIFTAAFAASGLKLVNIFAPGPGPIAALNPAIAIICEAVVVTTFLGYLRPSRRFIPESLLAISFSWRLLYLCLSGFLGWFFPLHTGFAELGALVLFKFFLFESLINFFIIYLLFKEKHKTIYWPLTDSLFLDRYSNFHINA